MKKIFIITTMIVTIIIFTNSFAYSLCLNHYSFWPFESKILINNNQLSTKEYSWYFLPSDNETPSRAEGKSIELLQKYNGYYLGDTSHKYIYLTFDEGYENGYTEKILDTLKSNNVKAAFFVTVPYIKSNVNLVKRMAEEGNLVCNHSNTHSSMASITDEEKFKWEIASTEEIYKEATGHTMSKFFRPPMGKYSELSLYYTKKLGYKTIFWSLAHKDWLKNNQPEAEKAKNLLLKRTHPGGIYLLHAVSKTNCKILDSLIKDWKAKGYEFKTLDDLQAIQKDNGIL